MQTHMRPWTLARLAALALLAATATAVAAPKNTVTTSLSFVDPPYSNHGVLKAKFQATDLGNGTWSVSATFKPQQLTHGVYSDYFGWSWYTVHGTGSAVAIATPGVSVAITAQGLSYTTTNGIVHALDVKCNFTVGTDGVVSAGVSL